jgi:hypothetical protein
MGFGKLTFVKLIRVNFTLSDRANLPHIGILNNDLRAVKAEKKN